MPIYDDFIWPKFKHTWRNDPRVDRAARSAELDALVTEVIQLERRYSAGTMPQIPLGPLNKSLGQFWRQLQQQECALIPWDRPANWDDVPNEHLQGWLITLHRRRYFLIHRARMEQLLHRTIADLWGMLEPAAPARTDEEGSLQFTVPLVELLPHADEVIEQVLRLFTSDELTRTNVLINTARELWGNCNRYSNVYDPPRPTKGWPRYLPLLTDLGERLDVGYGRGLTLPTKCNLSPRKMVETYLAHTPLKELFLEPVALRVSRRARFDHMHIVGGSGAGKTTFLQNLLLKDIRAKDSPSLVVIDPHADLVQSILHADLGIEQRVIYINPRDIEHPPALNIFAQPRDRLAGYDAGTREMITAGVIQTFEYLFTGIFSAELTTKQSVPFRFMARLLLSFPETMGRNATILDMLRLMNDVAPYQAAIAQLPEIPRDFFEHDFMGKGFAQTREQIRYRLQVLLENPTLARLLLAPETKINLFKELNQGSIILVDAAKDFLKDGSSIFGRVFISLVLQAILERAAIPEQQRRDTFLIVDEAATFFDTNIDDLLTDARKFHCGVVLAHQYLDQADPRLRASLASSTSLKMAARVSANDARTLANEMRTDAEFILAQPAMHFATFVRGLTSTAVSVPIHREANIPQLSASRYEALLQRSRERVSIPKETPPPPPPPQPQPSPSNPGWTISAEPGKPVAWYKRRPIRDVDPSRDVRPEDQLPPKRPKEQTSPQQDDDISKDW